MLWYSIFQYIIKRIKMPEKIVIKNKQMKESSRKWLIRQMKDPYVSMAKKQGYRSRASFKLIEINKKYKILHNNDIVIDLGAAPGGWSQVASKICRYVIAVDLLKMEPIPNVNSFVGDFLNASTLMNLKQHLNGRKANVILSDMAPKTCGIKKIDHIRIMSLIEGVFEFSKLFLQKEGSMAVKVFQGGTESKLLSVLKKHFTKVSHFKPAASRKESVEMYLVAQGFKFLS